MKIRSALRRIDFACHVQTFTMSDANPKDPLHGITLEKILIAMVDRFGWEEMGRVIEIRCFVIDPSIKSSLKFLRRTPWARKKLEDWYVSDFCG